MARALTRQCKQNVSRIELVIARAVPRTSPSTKIPEISYQSYCRWMTAQRTDVTTVAPYQRRRDAASPLKRKPRKAISSKTGAQTTSASQMSQRGLAELYTLSMNSHAFDWCSSDKIAGVITQ